MTNKPGGNSPEDMVTVYALISGSPYNKVKFYAIPEWASGPSEILWYFTC